MSLRPDRLLTLGLVAPIRKAMRSTARTLPVLMYHSISAPIDARMSPYYQTCTSPRRFEEHMARLSDGGWTGVSLDEGLRWLDGRQAIASKPCAITFDDGFADFLTAGVPAMERRGFSATMYLPTGFIRDGKGTFKSRGCLSWGEVVQLSRAGFEFGSHSVTHPKLYRLSPAAIMRELADSKADIERHTGKPVHSFAYPYAFPDGDFQFVRNFVGMLQACGYENCATTRVGRVSLGADRFQLKRLPVNELDDHRLLSAKLEGAYDWLGGPQYFFKRLRLRLESLCKRPVSVNA